MSEGLIYVLKGTSNIPTVLFDTFATANVIRGNKGWFKIQTLASYKLVDGVWKRRDFGPEHRFPVLSARNIGGLLIHKSDKIPYIYEAINQEFIDIVNNCTETFLQPLYHINYQHLPTDGVNPAAYQFL